MGHRTPPDGVGRSDDQFQELIRLAYAVNAMPLRPNTPHKMMGVISRVTCTPMNTRLSIAGTVAAATMSAWRLPAEGTGDYQPDRTDEFEDAERHPGFPRQRTK